VHQKTLFIFLLFQFIYSGVMKNRGRITKSTASGNSKSQGKDLNDSTGRRSTGAYLRRWAGRLLMITTIFGGNMGRLAAEPSKERAKEQRDVGDSGQRQQLREILELRREFDTAYSQINEDFNAIDDMRESLGEDASDVASLDETSDSLQDFINATAQLASELDLPQLRLRGNDEAKLRAFNNWMEDVLGTDREPDADFTRDDLIAIESLVMREQARATREATGLDERLARISDERRAAREEESDLAITTPVREDQEEIESQQEPEPPQAEAQRETAEAIEEVTPEPPIEEVVERPRETEEPTIATADGDLNEIDLPGGETVSQIDTTTEAEQMRLRQLARQAVEIADATLRRISSTMPEGQLMREYIQDRRDSMQRIINSDEALNSRDILERYIALARDCDAAGTLIDIWEAIPEGQRGEAIRTNAMQEAVRTLSDHTYNPLPTITLDDLERGYLSEEEQELLAIAEQYGLSAGRRGLNQLRSALQEHIGQYEEATNLPQAEEQLRDRMQGVLDRIDGGDENGQLLRMANLLLMEAEIIRITPFRRNWAIYRAYEALVPPDREDHALANRNAESAVQQLAEIESSLFVTTYMYDLLRLNSTESPAAVLFGDVNRDGPGMTDYSGTVHLGETVLYEAPSALDYLDNALESANSSGMSENNEIYSTAEALRDQLIELRDQYADDSSSVSEERMGELTELAYRCAIGLMYIRDAQIRLDNNDDLFSVSPDRSERAQNALDSAKRHFIAAFSQPEEPSSYYMNLSTARAVSAIEMLSPESSDVLGPVALRRTRDMIRASRSLRMDIFNMEMEADMPGAVIDPLDLQIRREDLQEPDTNPFGASHDREAFIRRWLRSIYRNQSTHNFTIPVSRQQEEDTGYLHANQLIDMRLLRFQNVPDEPQAPNPWEVRVDTQRDQYGRFHYRDQGAVVSSRGFVPQEIERQRLLHEDESAPNILRNDLSTREGAEAVGLDSPIAGYEAIDFENLDMQLAALARRYGETNADDELHDYQEIIAGGNGVLLDVLETRVRQLQMLLNRTEEPEDEDLRHYQYASRSLEEARQLLATMENNQRQSLFDLDSASANPLEAIAIAENGLVAISQVDGFGTHNPTPEELRFQRFFTGEPRAQVVGSGPYRVTMRIDVVTASGDRMSLEEYDQARETAGLRRIRRFPRFILYEEEFGTNGNIYRLRNPRFGIDDGAPEYLGIANIREGRVYLAELTPGPDGGENWVPVERDGEPVILYEINSDLEPTADSINRVINTEHDPHFRANTDGTMWVPRNGRPCPTPVGTIFTPQRRTAE
jgi:hypothetical protein